MVWGSDEKNLEAIRIEGRNGHFIQEGQTVFRWATTKIAPVAIRAAEAAGVALADIDVLVTHQANLRIIEAIAKKIISAGAPPDLRVGKDIVTSGNTSSASIPLALDRMRAAGEAVRRRGAVGRVRRRADLREPGVQMPLSRSPLRDGLTRRQLGRTDHWLVAEQIHPRVRAALLPANPGRMRHNSRGYQSRLRSGERPVTPERNHREQRGHPRRPGRDRRRGRRRRAADVTADKSFTDDLDIDSLSMVEIAVQAEDKFGVKIPDDELANLKTVGDAVAYIEANKA